MVITMINANSLDLLNNTNYTPISDHSIAVECCHNLFNSVISISKFLLTNKCKYFFQSKYYYSSLYNLEKYKKFSRVIINFSSNNHNRIMKVHRAGIETLQKFYGKEKIANWMQLEEKTGMSLQLLDIDLLRPGKGGCCFGMSLEFLFHYLQLEKKGIDSFKAVKSISTLFSKGITKEALLIQIFYKSVGDANKNRFDPIMNELDGKLTDIGNEIKDLNEQRKLLYNKIKDAEKDAEKDLKLLDEKIKLINEKYAFLFQLHNDKLMRLKAKKISNEVIAEHIGIKIEKSCDSLTLKKEIEENILLEEIENFINKLPNGAYQGIISDDSDKPTHAVVFIKTDGEEQKNFIFDPNVGTLAIDKTQTALELFKVLDYDPDEELKIWFHKCSILNDFQIIP